MNIYITGIGIISAIGLNAEENLCSLLDEKTGIKKSKIFSSDENIFVGEVKYSNEEFIEKFNLKKNPYSRTSLLGIAAAKERWEIILLIKTFAPGLFRQLLLAEWTEPKNITGRFCKTKRLTFLLSSLTTAEIQQKKLLTN